ncbi:MAG: SBBP repeat-containing protein [Bacteroidia bacterium]|nr:SBBP repeat-containing protein [Bacteroidia bacterium]
MKIKITKKKFLTLIVCLMFSVQFINAQALTFDWAKQIAGSVDEIGRSVAVDASGNVYSTGTFQGTVDFDPGAGTFNLTSAGAKDIFILKLDALGNFVWAKRIGSTSNENAYSLSLDASANIHITGDYTLPVDFDPNVGVATLNYIGQSDVFVLKLDASGNYIWAKGFGGTNFDFAYTVCVDGAGNVYTTGSFQLTVDFDPGAGTSNIASSGSSDIFISKLDASGNFVWAKKLGGSSADIGRAIKVDGSGNVYTTGEFQGVADFDPNAGVANLTSSGASDIFISKLDVSGNFVWAKQMAGGTLNDVGNSIWLNSTGSEIFTTGYFQNTVDFDPGAGISNLTSFGVEDVFISKLDASGNFLLAKQLGGTGSDIGTQIIHDPSGNIYCIGYFAGTGDFDPGVSSFNLSSSGNNDIFISKLNSTGNYSWAGKFGGPNDELGYSVTADASGNIYSTGSFQSTADFDPGAGVINLSFNGGYNIYVNKLGPCIAPASPTNITPSASLSICANKSTTLSASSSGAVSWFSNATGGASIGTGTNYVTPILSTGTYTYYAEALTCVTSVTRTAVTVTVNPNPTITVNSGTICSGKIFTMTPSGGISYTYSSGSNTVSPLANNSFTVSGSNTFGCVNTAISNVVVNATPTISVNNGTICSGQIFTMVPSGGVSYTYSSGSNTVSALTNSTYTVIGISSQGCTNTAVSNLVVNTTPTLTVNGGAVCPGGSFTFTPSGASTYTFSSGSAVVTPTSTTNYTITGTSAQGCNASQVVATVVYTNNLVITISSSNTVCNGQATTLTGNGASTYSWSTGATTPTISVTPTSNTTYSVIGASGSCSNTAVKSITVNPNPTVTAVSSTSLICVGQTATLTASGANSYVWSPSGSGVTVVISPTVTSTYTVTGADGNGCSNTAIITQSVSLCTNISGKTENNIGSITVYPNPNNGEFTIATIKGVYFLINTLGQTVKTVEIKNDSEWIEVNDLSQGIYYIIGKSAKTKIIITK